MIDICINRYESQKVVDNYFDGIKHKNCDIAAVKVIVEEAGGTVTDLFGNEQRDDKSINGAVISNGKVHNKVINIIKKYIRINEVDLGEKNG